MVKEARCFKEKKQLSIVIRNAKEVEERFLDFINIGRSIFIIRMDNIISNFIDSFQNILFAHSVDKFIKLHINNADDFITKYKSLP